MRDGTQYLIWIEGIGNMLNNKQKYWDGNINKICRYWFYILRGLDTFNQFKYLIGAIFALYWMLKLENPIIFVVIFIMCIPILFIAGYYHVHYVGKVIDWLNIEYSSHWSRYSFELSERNVRALESIDKKIK